MQAKFTQKFKKKKKKKKKKKATIENLLLNLLSPGLLRLEGEGVPCLCPHDTPLLGLGGQPVFQTLLGLRFLDSARLLFTRFLLVLQLGKFELAMGDFLQLVVASLIAYHLLSCFLLHLKKEIIKFSFTICRNN